MFMTPLIVTIRPNSFSNFSKLIEMSTVPKRIPMIAIRANQPVRESDVVIEKYPFGGFYAY